jgi:hypothetical protein
MCHEDGREWFTYDTVALRLSESDAKFLQIAIILSNSA